MDCIQQQSFSRPGKMPCENCLLLTCNNKGERLLTSRRICKLSAELRKMVSLLFSYSDMAATQAKKISAMDPPNLRYHPVRLLLCVPLAVNPEGNLVRGGGQGTKVGGGTRTDHFFSQTTPLDNPPHSAARQSPGPHR